MMMGGGGSCVIARPAYLEPRQHAAEQEVPLAAAERRGGAGDQPGQETHHFHGQDQLVCGRLGQITEAERAPREICVSRYENV